MKKFLLSLIFIIALTGCNSISNTPAKRVENYFYKYQTLDKSVLDDLKKTLTYDGIAEKDMNDYLEFMKKHYQDLTYEIKNQKIDGDKATVEVLITTRNYSSAISNAEANKNDVYDFSAYRLDEMKKVKETTQYTLYITLTKKENKWKIDQLSNEDLNKINGLYSN